MATLDKWRPFLTTPKTLVFPRLELLGHDHAPPIVVGAGEVRMPTPNRFEYTLSGAPADVRHLFAAIRRLEENPYDGLARFRLTGLDEDGVDWSLGWTIPRIEPGNQNWSFTGDLDGLMPHDQSETVSAESCTELIFRVPVNHPMALAMGRYVLSEGPAEPRRREHTIKVVGSTIRFAYEPSSGALSVTASHSRELPPTYAEHWLGEPLRILFGQLIYPRLVARNPGGGRTHVSIPRSPGLIAEAGWAALWAGEQAKTGSAAFWSLYSALLTFVVRARDERGQPNFESNKVTKLYEEIIQAARGTRWVWALTFASSIEALVATLSPSDEKHPDSDDEGVAQLIAHIEAWSGNARLKAIATGAVQRSSDFPTVQKMRRLRNAHLVSSEQIKVWSEIRNSVMHGDLRSPYSSAEEDRKLLALAGMMHALTLEIVRRAAASPSGEESSPPSVSAE
jgi:hypothetical protein